MSNKIWISWERQRRSVELAASLNCKLYILEYSGRFRYIKSIVKTFLILLKDKPTILFVQNPSMILACFSVLFLKLIFNIPVIVDRHTNFYLTRPPELTFREFIFHTLSFLSIRLADLTIVTNHDLAHVVRVQGGKSFVLTDKIPELKNINNVKSECKKQYSVFFITSFANDEPVKEVFEACKLLEDQKIDFFVSGNYSKLDQNIINNLTHNVLLTGFLSEVEFVERLYSVDVVLVLTNIDYTLLCGCYEAVAANKPLVTTDTKVLKDLFEGAYFVNNDPRSIAHGISQVLTQIDLYSSKTKEMKKKISDNWNIAKSELETIISELVQRKI